MVDMLLSLVAKLLMPTSSLIFQSFLASIIVTSITNPVNAVPRRILPRQNSTEQPCAQVFNSDCEWALRSSKSLGADSFAL